MGRLDSDWINFEAIGLYKEEQLNNIFIFLEGQKATETFRQKSVKTIIIQIFLSSQNQILFFYQSLEISAD